MNTKYLGACKRGHLDRSPSGNCRTCNTQDKKISRAAKRKPELDDVKLFIVINPKNRDLDDIADECVVTESFVKAALKELNIPIGKVLVNKVLVDIKPRNCVG